MGEKENRAFVLGDIIIVCCFMGTGEPIGTWARQLPTSSPTSYCFLSLRSKNEFRSKMQEGIQAA